MKEKLEEIKNYCIKFIPEDRITIDVVETKLEGVDFKIKVRDERGQGCSMWCELCEFDNKVEFDDKLQSKIYMTRYIDTLN